MKPTMIAILLAGTMFAAPAFAQDYDEEGSFPGFRIEGRVGWDNSSLSADYTDPDDDDEVLSASASESGIAYGGEIGFDMLLPDSRILLGAYGGVDFSDTRMCAEVFEEDLGCAESGYNIAAGVRAGYALNPSFLVYAKGGYTNGEINLTYDGDVEDDDDELFELSENRDGYHVGAGLEFYFNRNVYAKLEYLYTGYGTLTYLGEDDDDNEISADIDMDRHQVIGGLGIRF